jgi:lipoprotein signal peptidase
VVASKQIFIFIILSLINIGVGRFISYQDFFYVRNYSQALFSFDLLILFLVILIGLLAIWRLNIIQKYPLLFTIILVGTFTNIIERICFGYVVDYFNFGIGVANLADIEIYTGCMIILYLELKTL